MIKFKLDQKVLLLAIDVDKRGRQQNDKHSECELIVKADMLQPDVVHELLGCDSPAPLESLFSDDPERNRQMLNLKNLAVNSITYAANYEATVGGTQFSMVHKVHAFNKIMPESGGVFTVQFKVQLLDPPSGFIDRCISQINEHITLRLEPIGLDLDGATEEEQSDD